MDSHGGTYQAAHDDLAFTRSTRWSSWNAFPSNFRDLGCLLDTSDWSGGGSCSSPGWTDAATASSADWFARLHDLIERLVELSRHLEWTLEDEVEQLTRFWGWTSIELRLCQESGWNQVVAEEEPD